MKYRLGSEVTEKEEPEKAVSSACGGSGQPPWSMLGALGCRRGECDPL